MTVFDFLFCVSLAYFGATLFVRTPGACRAMEKEHNGYLPTAGYLFAWLITLIGLNCAAYAMWRFLTLLLWIADGKEL